MKVTAAIEKREQLQPALEAENTDLIVIDSCWFEPASFLQISELVHGAGKKLGLRMPQIFRQRAENYFRAERDSIKNAGFDVILYRNFESLFFAGELGLAGEDAPKAALDHSVYLTNSAAVSMAEEIISGISSPVMFCTLPVEWNLGELCDIHTEWDRELVVYGRVPMMVTAQCIHKTTSGCDGKPRELLLRDRTGAEMPVKNCCRFCFNTIYNSVPVWIGDMEKELKRLAPERIRYEFSTENPEEAARILGGKRPPEGAFTRGHAKKSAE